MKITAQDEYGLRILLRIARNKGREGLSIPQLAELEGMSQANVSKLSRILRMAGFINSTKGQKGGYVLAKSTDSIIIGDVINSLGGSLYDDGFCVRHAGVLKICTNSVDCSIRSLWKILEHAINQVLSKVSLYDLMDSEENAASALQNIVEENSLELIK